MKRNWLLTAVWFALLTVLAFISMACTDNYRAKVMGGTMTVQLPAGQRLVNVTWKESNMWYLMRPMRDGETPETWTFREKSDMGMVEGTVIFKESK